MSFFNYGKNFLEEQQLVLEILKKYSHENEGKFDQVSESLVSLFRSLEHVYDSASLKKLIEETNLPENIKNDLYLNFFSSDSLTQRINRPLHLESFTENEDDSEIAMESGEDYQKETHPIELPSLEEHDDIKPKVILEAHNNGNYLDQLAKSIEKSEKISIIPKSLISDEYGVELMDDSESPVSTQHGDSLVEIINKEDDLELPKNSYNTGISSIIGRKNDSNEEPSFSIVVDNINLLDGMDLSYPKVIVTPQDSFDIEEKIIKEELAMESEEEELAMESEEEELAMESEEEELAIESEEEELAMESEEEELAMESEEEELAMESEEEELAMESEEEELAIESEEEELAMESEEEELAMESEEEELAMESEEEELAMESEEEELAIESEEEELAMESEEEELAMESEEEELAMESEEEELAMESEEEELAMESEEEELAIESEEEELAMESEEEELAMESEEEELAMESEEEELAMESEEEELAMESEEEELAMESEEEELAMESEEEELAMESEEEELAMESEEEELAMESEEEELAMESEEEELAMESEEEELAMESEEEELAMESEEEELAIESEEEELAIGSHRKIEVSSLNAMYYNTEDDKLNNDDWWQSYVNVEKKSKSDFGDFILDSSDDHK